MTDHHFYAATGYGWATAATKEAAIKKLACYIGATTLERARKGGDGGLFALVVRVDLPEKAHYMINHYLPSVITKEDGVNEARKGEPVPMGEVERILITHANGKHKPAPAD